MRTDESESVLQTRVVTRMVDKMRLIGVVSTPLVTVFECTGREN